MGLRPVSGARGLALNVGLAVILYAVFQILLHGATLATAVMSGLGFGLIYGPLMLLIRRVRGR
ncbi:hypothetical protein N9H60_01255 [Flavimaricola sp.]|nr:hypothetical protein [Flavimaricola sp.]MDA9019790.1 hypothetical protein [Flavimaricola sp.]